jgi:hypothetical protein
MVTAKRMYRVVKPYTRQYADPISFERGESITVERQDDQFPGWWWCTDKRGKSGWVHREFFEEDDYRMLATEDYIAWEINVTEGDMLAGEREVGGWLLATTTAGERGWVPLTHVELV